MQLIHKKDYDDDDFNTDNEVRVEEDKTVKGYRFSFSVSKSIFKCRRLQLQLYTYVAWHCW